VHLGTAAAASSSTNATVVSENEKDCFFIVTFFLYSEGSIMDD
jgi:hypothetical protein